MDGTEPMITGARKRELHTATVYLGNKEETRRRLERLDSMAKSLGVSRSRMLQMLADGRLMLVVTASSTAAP